MRNFTKQEVLEKIASYRTQGFLRYYFGFIVGRENPRITLLTNYLATLANSDEVDFDRFKEYLSRQGLSANELFNPSFLSGNANSAKLFRSITAAEKLSSLIVSYGTPRARDEMIKSFYQQGLSEENIKLIFSKLIQLRDWEAKISSVFSQIMELSPEERLFALSCLSGNVTAIQRTWHENFMRLSSISLHATLVAFSGNSDAIIKFRNLAAGVGAARTAAARELDYAALSGNVEAVTTLADKVDRSNFYPETTSIDLKYPILSGNLEVLDAYMAKFGRAFAYFQAICFSSDELIKAALVSKNPAMIDRVLEFTDTGKVSVESLTESQRKLLNEAILRKTGHLSARPLSLEDNADLLKVRLAVTRLYLDELVAPLWVYIAPVVYRLLVLQKLSYESFAGIVTNISRMVQEGNFAQLRGCTAVALCAEVGATAAKDEARARFFKITEERAAAEALEERLSPSAAPVASSSFPPAETSPVTAPVASPSLSSAAASPVTAPVASSSLPPAVASPVTAPVASSSLPSEASGTVRPDSRERRGLAP